MSMTPLDKMKLMGVIKKIKIDVFDDLYIDSRSKLTIYDFLAATISLTLKFVEDNQSEKLILNGLRAIEVVLMQMYSIGKDISEKDVEGVFKLKELVSSFDNEEIKDKCDTLINIYQSSFIRYVDKDEMEENDSIDAEDEPSLEYNEQETEYTDQNPEEEIEYVDVTDEMRELENTIAELQRQLDELNKEIKRKDQTISANKKNLDEKNKSLVNYRNEAKRLSKEISKLNNSYNSLNGMYKKVTSDLKTVEQEKANLEKKNRELVVQNRKMKVSFKETDAHNSETKKHEELYDAVLRIIANKRLTILDICHALKEDGIIATLNEINSIIQEIKAKYEIDDTFLVNFEKTYIIVAKKPENNKIFDISTKKVFEFIVSSDAHISYLLDCEISAYDKIYDYMYCHNISTAIDLGDFVDIIYPKESDRYECMKYCDRILDRIIQLFPSEKGIKLLIMGGNHEELILKHGIDPIEYLELNRADFISLGHVSAFLKFNKTYIGLFHPAFRLKEDTPTLERLDKFVISKCRNVKINREAVLMSLFGHFHMGDIGENGVVTVPSITRDRDFDGTWHVKVYLDDTGNIENIELTRIGLRKKAYAAETYEIGKKLIR